MPSSLVSLGLHDATTLCPYRTEGHTCLHEELVAYPLQERHVSAHLQAHRRLLGTHEDAAGVPGGHRVEASRGN